MIFKKTKIEGVYIIQPELKTDERGYFARIFCKKEFFEVTGMEFDVKQANQSLTKKKGTIRGMHFQEEPKAEGKMVQCLKGSIYDVGIDLRESSPSYGKWIAVELSDKNKKILFIPKGFAHGFQTLEDNCIVQYLMSEPYNPKYSKGVRFNDPLFKINWPIKNNNISGKDKNWPLVRVK